MSLHTQAVLAAFGSVRESVQAVHFFRVGYPLYVILPFPSYMIITDVLEIVSPVQVVHWFDVGLNSVPALHVSVHGHDFSLAPGPVDVALSGMFVHCLHASDCLEFLGLKVPFGHGVHVPGFS